MYRLLSGMLLITSLHLCGTGSDDLQLLMHDFAQGAVIGVGAAGTTLAFMADRETRLISLGALFGSVWMGNQYMVNARDSEARQIALLLGLATGAATITLASGKIALQLKK
jgi:hypothetical protein